MKKIKFTALIALTMCGVILLSSCGLGNLFNRNRDLSALLNVDAPYDEGSSAVYSNVEKLDFKGDTHSQLGTLAYFRNSMSVVEVDTTGKSESSSYTVHTVYNIATNEILYTSRIDSENVSVNIALDSISTAGGKELYFYTVTRKDENIPKNYKTSVYDEHGNELVSVDKDVAVRKAVDLFGLDGKYFRVNSEGYAEHAFDLPEYTSLPQVTHRYKNYYYRIDTASVKSKNITVYDEELNFVSRYDIPDYAEHVTATILKNGNVFLQYCEQVNDVYNYEYDFKTSSSSVYGVPLTTPYLINTFIIDPDNGKAKEIDCDDYKIVLAFGICDPRAWEEDMFNVKKLGTVGVAVKIEKGKAADLNLDIDDYGAVFVSIDKNGKVSEYSGFNGELLSYAYRCAEDRWVIETPENEYLVDEDLEIIGNISNATVNVKAQVVCTRDKIYDLDLNLIYDLGDNHMTIVGTADDNLVLQDESGSVYIYDKVSEPKILTSADTTYKFLSVEGDCIFIQNSAKSLTAPDIIIYNADGEKLYTIENVVISLGSHIIENLGQSDNAVIISIRSDIYRISK